MRLRRIGLCARRGDDVCAPNRKSCARCLSEQAAAMRRRRAMRRLSPNSPQLRLPLPA